MTISRRDSVTTIPSGDTNSGDIYPEIGITGTPVIDPSSNIIYLIPNTKEIVGGNAYYVQRLHAINISDGTDAAPSFVIGTTTNGNTNTTPVSVAGTGDGNVDGVVQFNALRENNRPALSLVNGEVYAEWASHGDNGPYHGWVVRWDVTNLSTQGMVLSGAVHRPHLQNYAGLHGQRRRLKILSVAYDPAARTVTIRTRQRINPHGRYQLEVNGGALSGLISASGVYLDGDGTGVAELWRPASSTDQISRSPSDATNDSAASDRSSGREPYSRFGMYAPS